MKTLIILLGLACITQICNAADSDPYNPPPPDRFGEVDRQAAIQWVSHLHASPDGIGGVSRRNVPYTFKNEKTVNTDIGLLAVDVVDGGPVLIWSQSEFVKDDGYHWVDGYPFPNYGFEHSSLLYNGSLEGAAKFLTDHADTCAKALQRANRDPDVWNEVISTIPIGSAFALVADDPFLKVVAETETVKEYQTIADRSILTVVFTDGKLSSRSYIEK